MSFRTVPFFSKECALGIRSIPVSVTVTERGIFLLFTIDKEPSDAVYLLITIVCASVCTVIINIAVFLISIIDNEFSACACAVVGVVLGVKIIVGVVKF